MGHLKSIIFLIHRLAKGLFFGLMITTAWMAYRVCESALGGSTTLPDVYESIIVVSAALVLTYLIDNGLYHNAVAALAQTIEQKGIWRIWKEGGITTIVLLSLLLGRFFFSGGATYLTGESTVTERQAGSDNIELVGDIAQQKTDALSSIRNTRQAQADKLLADAKREAQEIKTTAENLAVKKVESAIAQGSTSEQEAYKRNDWIRASYSTAIKKAKREAYKMEEKAAMDAQLIISQAKQQHKAILANMDNELYNERNSAKWSQLQNEVDRKISAQEMLWTAERWTYYLIDFILVVGGFFCSWLVAVYIVKEKEQMSTFFPDKPGIMDVIGDSLDSVYAYIVTVIAQVPAFFKLQTSKKMVKVAKSVGQSSASYNTAIAEYIVASHPAINAQVGAVAHHNAMLAAEERASKKMKTPTPDRKSKTQPKQPETSATQQAQQEAQQQHPIELEVNNSLSATAQQQSATATQQESNSATATQQVKQSGNNFRAYLSRAGAYASQGDLTRAKECLKNARAALPDDHLKASRIEKYNLIKNMIDEQ